MMKVDRYSFKSDDSLTVFEFVSVGPNGSIRKQIHFQLTDIPGVYNLAFGDKYSDTEEIDDLAVTNNGDTKKVLGTLGAALYTFFDNYPNTFVYAKGSTPVRTRLYRMGITKFYGEIIKDFNLFGRIDGELYEFEIGVVYEAFLAQRKFN